MPKVKDKERILKAAREKQLVTYKGVSTRLSADFSMETLQARRKWQEIFKVMKSKDLQPRLLYPSKLSFRIKGHIKSFPDKKKLKEFIKTKPVIKITNMNNKTAINMYLSTTESKNKIFKKKKRNGIINTRTFCWLPDGRASAGWVKEVKG